MPAFRYKAIGRDGAETSGLLDALDVTEAREQLRARTLMPLELDLATASSIRRQSTFGLVNPARYLWVRNRDLQFFFRQMALMARAGHRIRQALDASADLVERERLRRAILRMVDAIDAGSSLADAFRSEKRLFPTFVAALVEAGEKSGSLDRVFAEVGDALERAHKLRNTLMRALLFPAITLLVAFAVLFFITFWLVPILTGFLRRNQAEVHWTMQLLIDTTDFLLDYGPAILIGIGIFSFVALVAYTTTPGRRFEDRVLLSLPLIGPTLRLFEMSRFGIVGALLLQAGLRHVEALTILSNVTQNFAYRFRYLAAADRLRTGDPMSVSLGSGIVPKLVTHMLSIGEMSGSQDEVLDRVGTYYSEAVETRISVLVSTLVPVVTIIVGVIVAIIYIAVILTILNAYNSVR
ncbi:MAG: type II secretion system F family protein [Pseudomonadota bacterium]